jgi:TolA-binding protein
MTTQTKPKKAKAPKKAPEKNMEEYMDLEEVLQSHKDGLTALEEVINDHALQLDRLNHASEVQYDEITELKELLVHSVNSLFWMSAIGIAVAITFAGVAVFRN